MKISKHLTALSLVLFGMGKAHALAGVYETFAQAAVNSCGVRFPCAFDFNRLPFDWKELVVFKYTASDIVIKSIVGKTMGPNSEFSDKYAIVTRTGGIILEERLVDIERPRNGDFVFALKGNENYKKIFREYDSFKISKISTGPRDWYFLVEIVSKIGAKRPPSSASN